MTWNPPFNVKLNKDLETAGTVTGSKFVDTTKNLLSEAALWFDASYSGGGQTIRNLGYGGRQLDGQNGSTSGADTNDALHLNWPGDNAGNYVYLPGVNGNALNVPDEDALDITGDIDLRLHVALDSYTPASGQSLMSKWNGTTNNRGFSLRVLSTGVLRFQVSDDGVNLATNDSTVALNFADDVSKWLRVTLRSSDGRVQFFTSDDGVSWVQLGADRTSARTSVFVNDVSLFIGSELNAIVTASGKFYRAQVLDGIDGTTVLDVDTSVITSGSATSFTAITGQTVTINRSTSGRKSVAVVSPVWLFGTDDYMNVPNNALLYPDTSTNLTVIATIRKWDEENFASFVNTRTSTDNVGYQLMASNNGTGTRIEADDGPNFITIQNASALPVDGSVTVIGFIWDQINQEWQSFSDGTLSSSFSTSTIGSIASGDGSLRIGTNSDNEILSVAIFRRLLSTNEIAAISAYYQARLS